jgi:shikimate dehydrogenase
MPENTAPSFLASLTGCFAQPVAENPSVVMVEAAYQHHDLHWRYINCEIAPDNLGAAVKGAMAMGWKGFNCSLPHKVAVIQHLDGVGESAAVIGAVNTVVNRDGKWIGENTDGKGFVKGLSEITSPVGKKVVLFGAGGAARAVAVEMAMAGAAHIAVVNRGRERGETLVNLLSTKTAVGATYIGWDSTYSLPEDTDIVINVTSIGLFPNVHEQLNIDFDSLKPEMVVADGIPNPPETHLIMEAKRRGCRTVDGLTMLVNQGVIGIKYWTGVDVDPTVMHRALKEALHIEQ